MTINQERFTTYKALSPVLRTQTTAFQAIKNDCKMLFQLLESGSTKYGEQGLLAIDAAVYCFIQSTFTLIGIYNKEYEIIPKLREYEVQEQKRNQV